jgi:hypothetical protein
MSSYPPFPKVLDSTIISAYRACPQKCFREYIQHWKPKTPSVHLHAGGAYARGLEIARKAFYLSGHSEQDSIAAGLKALIEFYGDFECPADSAKSLDRTAGAFEYYFTQYPMGSDKAVPITLPSGERGIEFSFAEPIDITHPETGDPLIYCGRMDMIADFAGGVFGEDDKTTSALGATWPKQWDMRAQFTGYCWGAARAGFPLSGFLIRGVSILKTKYETLQAVTYRPDWMIDRWYEGLIQTVGAMLQSWETGYWAYDEADACSAYGGCLFKQVCLSRDPDPWLEGSFIRRVWNPLTRTEEETLL